MCEEIKKKENNFTDIVVRPFRKLPQVHMRHTHTKWIVRLVILILFTSILPVHTSELYAQRSTSKKSTKKKSSGKKKSSSKKKRSKKAKGKKSSGSKKAQAKKYVDRGKKRYKAKKYRGALDDFKKAHKIAPSKTTNSYISRITGILKKGSSKKKAVVKARKPTLSAMKLAGELYDLNNDLTDSRRRMGRAMKYLKPRQERHLSKLESRPVYTTADFEQAADSAPDDLRMQRQLGLHYEVNGNWSKAKDVYLRQIARHYDNPDAHFFLGSLYEKLGDFQKAQQSYEEALDLDVNHKATLDAMAVHQKDSPAVEMSRQVLVRTAAKAPEGPAQQFTLIHEKINAGLFNDAIAMAEKAAEKYPDQNGFIFLQAIAYNDLGEIDLAKAAFQQSIRMDPKHKESHLGLGNLYYNMGKYIYAALGFGDVVYLDPQDLDARYMQGLSYFNAQEWGLAASVWEDLLHYQSQHPIVRNLLPQAYYILAIEYNRLGEPSLGRTSFEKALSVNSNSYAWLPGAFRTLGKYYQEKGMHKESLVAYQEVLELRPNDSSAYTGMGVTYWKMNEHQLAKAAWNRSLQISPDANDAKGWLILSKRLGS